MKIYIIRHGQTTSDTEDRYGGDYDDHLTEVGVTEAERLGTKIKGFGIEMIFASPRIRAQETAKILQKDLGLEIKTMDEFRERNQYGVLTGMVKAEAKEKYPELVETLKDWHNTIEGAENSDEFIKRINEGFKKVTESGFNTVAVVTHGGPIRRILGNILGMERKWEIADCGYLEIEYVNNVASLIGTEGISSN